MSASGDAVAAGIPRPDVVVVGGGPAGASAALHLARRGIDVLVVDKATFPRDKACGDGLTPGAVEQLAMLGVAPNELAADVIRGIDVTVADRGSRRMEFRGFGLVVPRRRLDAILLDRAVRAGARFLGGVTVERALVSGGATVGVAVRDRQGRNREILARAVVGADGSHSIVSRTADMRCRGHRGVAARAYFMGVSGLENRFHVYLPLPADEHCSRPAGYGWVFPLPDGSVNVGVGLLPTARPGASRNIRQVLEAFVAELRKRDSRFAQMRRCSRVDGAWLNCGFDPTGVLVEGLFLVGDAAGLVDPLTGEGIQWALESGALAADVIAHAPHSACAREYRRHLVQRHHDRIRFGRRCLEAPLFAWRVLEETFRRDGPSFSRLRRAIFDIEPVSSPGGGRTSARMFDMDDLFVDAVSHHVERAVADRSPLLGRVSRTLIADVDRRFRIAMYWQAMQCGTSAAAQRALGAACVELSYLGYRALKHVRDVDPVETQGQPSAADCANNLAVMCADLAIAKAYSIAAALGPTVCRQLAATTAKVCVAEASTRHAWAVAPPSPVEYLHHLAGRAPQFHVLAVEIACALAGVNGTVRAALLRAAEFIGLGFHLVAEIAEFAGQDDNACTATVFERLSTRQWTLPLAVAMEYASPECRASSRSRMARDIADALVRSDIMRPIIGEVRHVIAQAEAHIAAVPAASVRQALLGMAQNITSRAAAAEA